MDLILIGALTVGCLVVASYGVNTLLQIKGITVFPLLRTGNQRETLQTSSRISQKLQLASLGNQGGLDLTEEGGENMVSVNQIMNNKEPLKIRSEETVKTVAEKMLQYHVGSLLVEDGKGRVQGIVTETDIVRKVTAADIAPVLMQVGQVMSTPVITIDRTRPITEADELMDRHHTRHLGVTENGRIIGILSVRDLLHPIHQEQGALPLSSE
jgi:CBS domain-containing protein